MNLCQIISRDVFIFFVIVFYVLIVHCWTFLSRFRSLKVMVMRISVEIKFMKLRLALLMALGLRKKGFIGIRVDSHNVRMYKTLQWVHARSFFPHFLAIVVIWIEDFTKSAFCEKSGFSTVILTCWEKVYSDCYGAMHLNSFTPKRASFNNNLIYLNEQSILEHEQKIYVVTKLHRPYSDSSQKRNDSKATNFLQKTSNFFY